MINIYEVEIEGKNVQGFIRSLYKRHIRLTDISYQSNKVYLKLKESEYRKLLEIKTIYHIKLIKLYGPVKYKYLFKQYLIFIISVLFSFLLLILLSNIIFEVEVVHSSSKIRNIVYKELDRYEIKKYHFVKSFNTQEEIVKQILDNNKDTIEWLEIERIGTKYRIRVEERIINDVEPITNKRHLIAKKDGIITKISSSKGEIIRKIGDYVKKGDILISGYIHKNDDIKSIVSAMGKVYAEVWYTVDVEMPLHYYEEKNTGQLKNNIVINFFNKRYQLDFKPYQDKKITSKPIIYNRLLPVILSFDKEEELLITDNLYTIDQASEKASTLATEKLTQQLKEDAQIMYQKKLKTELKDSTIILTVFYKVNEDITDYIDIVESKVE